MIRWSSRRSAPSPARPGRETLTCRRTGRDVRLADVKGGVVKDTVA